ncbi:DUF7312 domain-containing protein [Haloarchaeobius amylolyticus]|uniref:DUF7312 domain-containing protein n=1 Tax=Haloarchaeobius amylolyticus TaxID=1198296 RepID=UPI002270FEF2|nr:hypothetical protein [Haloarchaeobius amylolyticus]
MTDDTADDQYRFSLEDLEDDEAETDRHEARAVEMGQYDPDEVIESGSIDGENALFVALGVLAMVAFFVHVVTLLG